MTLVARCRRHRAPAHPIMRGIGLPDSTPGEIVEVREEDPRPAACAPGWYWIEPHECRAIESKGSHAE